MKIVFILALIALAFAFAYAADTVADTAACNPDGDNKPTCTAAMAGQTFRNCWDPTAYWVCTGGAATPARCQVEHLYDSATSECVMYNAWSWTPCCPETA